MTEEFFSWDLPVVYKRVVPNVKLEKATAGSSGYDLRSAETCMIPAGKWRAIGTGLFLKIPCGYEGQVRSRSGLALKEGIFVLNSPGTVDADYRGELKIILCNLNNTDFLVNQGDRIAQIVFMPVATHLRMEEGDIGISERGENGFGSTGVK